MGPDFWSESAGSKCNTRLIASNTIANGAICRASFQHKRRKAIFEFGEAPVLIVVVFAEVFAEEFMVRSSRLGSLAIDRILGIQQRFAVRCHRHFAACAGDKDFVQRRGPRTNVLDARLTGE